MRARAAEVAPLLTHSNIFHRVAHHTPRTLTLKHETHVHVTPVQAVARANEAVLQRPPPPQ